MVLACTSSDGRSMSLLWLSKLMINGIACKTIHWLASVRPGGSSKPLLIFIHCSQSSILYTLLVVLSRVTATSLFQGHKHCQVGVCWCNTAHQRICCAALCIAGEEEEHLHPLCCHLQLRDCSLLFCCGCSTASTCAVHKQTFIIMNNIVVIIDMFMIILAMFG